MSTSPGCLFLGVLGIFEFDQMILGLKIEYIMPKYYYYKQFRKDF